MGPHAVPVDDPRLAIADRRRFPSDVLDGLYDVALSPPDDLRFEMPFLSETGTGAGLSDWAMRTLKEAIALQEQPMMRAIHPSGES